jgi:hypothetical protein
MSRVVPAIGDTIAAGRLAKALISDDFPLNGISIVQLKNISIKRIRKLHFAKNRPALGGPTIATFTPSRISSPLFPFCKWRKISHFKLIIEGIIA